MSTSKNQPYRSRAWINGATAAMQGVERKDNPYLPGAHSAFNRQDWFDGFNHAMMPDDDERAGGDPL